MGDLYNILVVEDNPAVREGFAQELSDHGHVISTATSGEDALWQLNRGAYDLLVTGMTLRGMSGLEVAQVIHAQGRGLPVIIINEQGKELPQERATAPGTAEFLHQPLSAGQLADTVDRVLKAAKSAAGSAADISSVERSDARKSNPFVSRLKNIGLFLLGPIISLFYLLTFPVIGLGMLIYMAFTAKKQKSEEAISQQTARPSAQQAKSSIFKSAAMMAAMVIGGVAYGVFVPLMGIGVIIWFGLQAWGTLGSKAIGTDNS